MNILLEGLATATAPASLELEAAVARAATASHTTAVSASADKRWQWMDNDGWKDFSAAAQLAINTAVSRNAVSTTLVLQGGRPYVINFTMMRQYQKDDVYRQRAIRSLESLPMGGSSSNSSSSDSAAKARATVDDALSAVEADTVALKADLEELKARSAIQEQRRAEQETAAAVADAATAAIKLVADAEAEVQAEAMASARRVAAETAAATTLQSAYRGSVARKQFAAMVEAKAAETAVARLLSATTMQSVWRGRAARIDYNRIRTAIITIQAYGRGYIVRKQLPKTMPVIKAATMIQSAWRGYITRKQSSKKAQRLAARIAAANACAEEHMTLGARTVSALKILLTHKQLTFVLRACENLVVATKLSTGCCTRMVDAKAVPIIFQLVRSCNRSKPHMAVLVVALQIMLNLVKCKQTNAFVFQEGEAVGLMAELCQMYRDKTEIFAVVLEIMKNFTSDAEKVATIKKRHADMKRFDQIKSLLERKAKLSKKIDSTRTRKAAKPAAVGKGTKKKKAEMPAVTISDCLETLTRFVSTIKA